MQDHIVPLEIENIQDNIYAGFGLRLSSLLLDIIIILPIIFGIQFLNSQEKDVYLFTLIPFLAFDIWYNIYLPKRYGGTPGKLIMGIKIIRLDGTAIGWKEASLRHGVELLFTILYSIIHISCLSLANDSVFSNLSWTKQGKYLKSFYPLFFKIESWLYNGWLISELFILLTNPRKRALHDYMAGTVIVKAIYIEKIKLAMVDSHID